MKRFTVAVLTLTLLCPAHADAQQPGGTDGSLPAFRSEAELSHFLDDIASQLERARRRCNRDGVDVRTRVGGAAQPDGAVVLRGRAMDASGDALEGAMVEIPEFGLRSITTADGTYRLAIPSWRITERRNVVLRASFIGFDDRIAEVRVRPGDEVVVDLVLCDDGLDLAKLEVGTAEAVTNVQHAGVDEGGIVKLRGDHLVVLRRGRLFAIDIGQDRLEPVSVVDAFGPDIDPRNTWYDELLVSDDVVVVVGYSYERGGTELGLFHLDDGGRLHYRATYHLRSHDYYSSRNYASRLIGTKLVLYVPLSLPPGRRAVAAAFPAMRRWSRDADEDDFRPILSATRVYRPAGALRAPRRLALHSVTICDLAAAELTCEATAVLGPPGHVFYVSPTAVYVWLRDWRRGRATKPDDAMVYRIPLDGSAPAALAVRGSPVDQFSFLESDDGHLNVLVRSRAMGEWMWHADLAAGDAALLRVPLALFSDGRREAPPSAYLSLPVLVGGVFHNRFVGEHLLYGVGSGWLGPTAAANGSALYVLRWADGALSELWLPHGVDRIEALGTDAVVIGSDGRDLHFTGVDLDALPAIVQRYVQRGAAQGELRSHGFFYRADGPDSGVLGLPFRASGGVGYHHLFKGSAGVLFLRNADGRFHELGVLAASADEPADDGCVASCVDWYGNARPIFVQGRIFALLGYELVEGTLEGGRIRETRRIDFAPHRAEPVAPAR